MKINKDAFKELALTLHFELQEHELEKLYVESESLLSSLENLANLNVDNIPPMHYPISHSFNTLREDQALKIHDSDNYLKNAKHHLGKYILVK
jgi:aspartyl/glutamyl-tRNA(Asn/Gln) amidotransferase C subunit